MINKVKQFDDVRASKFVDYFPVQMVIETPGLDILKTLNFNQSTIWSDDTLPKIVLEHGKKVPLGIENLHKSGILGTGVNLAIIDQPLALNHPEYTGKIAEYKLFMPKNYNASPSSMHGPAVTSLLVGETVGVAPGAKVFYAACPSWLRDARYETEALNWIMKVNKNLSDNDKIKFVSVSAAPGDQTMRSNHMLWLDAVKKAEEQGLCVLECTPENCFIYPGYIDYDSGEFCYGFPNQPWVRIQEGKTPPPIGKVFVPNSLRTFAENYDGKHFSYQYNGSGGLSWGIPFAAGVLALGQQINRDLSAKELKSLLIKSAAKNKGIIDPESFLTLAKPAINSSFEK